MRRAVSYLLYLVIFVVLLLAPTAARYLRFYGARGAERPATPVYEPAGVPELVPTPAANTFVDNPEVGQGWVLLDRAHDNRFDLNEIDYLDSRLAARGYELRPFEEGDLATALRPVSAFVVIAPMRDFDAEEVLAVEAFVERGGRLFLVGDPTRYELVFDDEIDFDPYSYSVETDDIALNSLANTFDLVYNGDYLYNTLESEGNFQNIILRQDGFAEGALTRGLEKLAFYGSHSIQTGPGSKPLLSADDNTWSSSTDRRGGLALAALGGSGQVLAVGDINFLSEPYYTVYDNSHFISQVADFLVGAQREYVLADFPYFFGDTIDLVYAGDPELGPGAFDEIVGLQNALKLSGRELVLAGDPDGQSGVLYAGLYGQSAELSDLLEAAGVSLVIEPPIETEVEAAATDEAAPDDAATEDGQPEEELVRRIQSDLGDVQMSGTALILATGETSRREIVVLAASAEGLENTLARLIALSSSPAEPALDDCMVQEELALCPSGVTDEPVEAELVTSGQPEQAPAGGQTPGGPDVSGLDADIQGPISLGDSVEGTLDEDQSHGWEFSDGPATVNIVLEAGEDLDGVLELYDPEGSLMADADFTLEGDVERLDSVQIPDDQTYTIVVRDYYDDGGSYTLSVTAVTPESLGAVDQGELLPGQPVDAILGENESHAWTFTVDEPAEADITLTCGPTMDGYLILVGPDGSFLEVVDNALTGEEETLTGYSLTETGDYTIVVGEYSDSGGEYTLLLELN